MARARSADGGPACWCSRLHGPRVYSVARRTSPSATYSASAVTELLQRRLRLGGVEQLDAPALLAVERTLDEIAPALVEDPLGRGHGRAAAGVERARPPLDGLVEVAGQPGGEAVGVGDVAGLPAEQQRSRLGLAEH